MNTFSRRCIFGKSRTVFLGMLYYWGHQYSSDCDQGTNHTDTILVMAAIGDLQCDCDRAANNLVLTDTDIASDTNTLISDNTAHRTNGTGSEGVNIKGQARGYTCA